MSLKDPTMIKKEFLRGFSTRPLCVRKKGSSYLDAEPGSCGRKKVEMPRDELWRHRRREEVRRTPNWDRMGVWGGETGISQLWVIKVT